MLLRKSLFYLSLTVWLDVKVEAYKSGCNGGHCFVMSDISNGDDFLYPSIAEERCRSNGTQLLEIRNKDIQNSLANVINSVYMYSQIVWNVLTNGKRSSDNWIRLNSSGSGIGSITVNDQVNKPKSYAYGYLKSTASGFDLFASRPADNKTGFICIGLSDCSGGVTINGQCYKSFSESLSWYDARNRCLEGGGDLASFDHITTNAGFNALNGSWISTSPSYWIGIRREWWTWQNSKSDVKYSNWLGNHPLDDDCLCLSPTQWKWVECSCKEKYPFVCFLENSTSNTPAISTKTITLISTPTASSTFNSSSTIQSEHSGISSPTVPSTVTSKSTTDANETENVEKSNVLPEEAKIGIGVGVGVGGAILIFALVAAVIILCRKCCPLRCPQKKPTSAMIHPSDILMVESINSDSNYHGIENPYAMVVPSSPKCDRANSNDYENFSQPPTVYAQLGFSADTQIRRNATESVFIVPGKTKPSLPPATDDATNHYNVSGDIYAEVTKA